jgi:hypothetical protein
VRPQLQQLLFASANAKERLAAYVEKRNPRFRRNEPGIGNQESGFRSVAPLT